MGNNLKKIKGLTTSRELADRVATAMFLYARNFDMSSEDSNEKKLANWAIQNPLAVDNTMLALVATDSGVVDAAAVIEETQSATSKKEAGNQGNKDYAPADVSIESVNDDVIIAAVTENWSRVAEKFEPAPAPIQEPAVMIPGSAYNVFLDTERAPSAAGSDPRA